MNDENVHLMMAMQQYQRAPPTLRQTPPIVQLAPPPTSSSSKNDLELDLDSSLMSRGSSSASPIYNDLIGGGGGGTTLSSSSTRYRGVANGLEGGANLPSINRQHLHVIGLLGQNFNFYFICFFLFFFIS